MGHLYDAVDLPVELRHRACRFHSDLDVSRAVEFLIHPTALAHQRSSDFAIFQTNHASDRHRLCDRDCDRGSGSFPDGDHVGISGRGARVDTPERRPASRWESIGIEWLEEPQSNRDRVY